MGLEFKSNWEEARKRLTAFWHGEETDRPPITVTAPNGREPRDFPAPVDPVTGFLDFDYRLDYQEEHIRCTYYAGEAVPSVWPDFGPNVMAGCLGGNLEVGGEPRPGLERAPVGTSWPTPVIEDWETDLPGIGFDPNNTWWKRIYEFTRLAVERSQGKYLVRIPDVDFGSDTCDALRGTSRLCLDLYDNPEGVLRLLSVIEEAKKEAVSRLCALLSRHEDGCVATFKDWGPGPFYGMRSDFSYLINPSKFRELFLAHKIREAEYLSPCTLFHCHTEDLDEKRAGRLAWLDVILSIPKLNGVQWGIPGSGDLEGLRRILDAGKFVYIYVPVSDIYDLLEALGSNRVWLRTAASCPEEADAAVKITAEAARKLP